jgi:hypothetical protein
MAPSENRGKIKAHDTVVHEMTNSELHKHHTHKKAYEQSGHIAVCIACKSYERGGAELLKLIHSMIV